MVCCCRTTLICWRQFALLKHLLCMLFGVVMSGNRLGTQWWLQRFSSGLNVQQGPTGNASTHTVLP
jgi:hypothetical protein